MQMRALPLVCLFSSDGSIPATGDQRRLHMEFIPHGLIAWNHMGVRLLRPSHATCTGEGMGWEWGGVGG